MVNDPIGDMISQIKNASLAGRTSVTLPYSRVKEQLAQIMKEAGYLSDVTKEGEAPKFLLTVKLRYKGRQPVISDLKRKSKPGLRVYVSKNTIPVVVGGMGVAIVSTSQGIMTGKEAKKRGLGGELLCEIW